MPKKAAVFASFILFVLGVVTSAFVVPAAGKPYCHGNSCHGTSTTLTTTTPATTTSTSTTTATTTATTTTTTTTTTPTTSTRRLFWGAWIGSQFTGSEAPWDWAAVNTFQTRDAGAKPLSLVHWSSPFYASFCGGAGGACNFAPATFQSVRDRGVIPFFSWANNVGADRDVTAGKYDAYITAWAQAAKAWGQPFFLRFAWEMNGSWFGWGVGNNGNTTADYVAMWRHVHDIFTSVGATNASWVWCPNIDPGNNLANLNELYPGANYVDWTCLDGYNGNVPWTSFRDLFASSYDRITQLAPDKPMIIGEVGSTETGGSKAQWINDMFTSLPSRFPNIRGLLWFDKNESGPGGHSDWPLESSTSAQTAFATNINTQAYTSNTYSTLTTSPIPPPS